MEYIGIDPGKNGAVAVIREDGTTVTSAFSEIKYLSILRQHKDAVAIVEDVHAMPKQGVSSMFSFGYNKGWIIGVLNCIGISVCLISPQKWKKYFGLGKDKSESIELAQALYSNANLFATPRCKKPHDGIAEALLMAEYGRRVV